MFRKTYFLPVKSRISSSVAISKQTKIEVGENMIPFICGKLGEQKSVLPSFPTTNVAILWICNRFPSKKMVMSSWWWLTSQHPVRSIPQKCRPGTWDDSVLADELDDLEDASTASTTVSEPQWARRWPFTVEILEDIGSREKASKQEFFLVGNFPSRLFMILCDSWDDWDVRNLDFWEQKAVLPKHFGMRMPLGRVKWPCGLPTELERYVNESLKNKLAYTHPQKTNMKPKNCWFEMFPLFQRGICGFQPSFWGCVWIGFAMKDAKTRKPYLDTEILQKLMSKIGLFGPIWVFFLQVFFSQIHLHEIEVFGWG